MKRAIYPAPAGADFELTIDVRRTLRLNASSLKRFKAISGIDFIKNPDGLKNISALELFIWSLAYELNKDLTIDAVRRSMSAELVVDFANVINATGEGRGRDALHHGAN